MTFLILTAAFALWQQSPLVFRGETNLVPIDVQVVDRNTRQPIAGLTRSDFVVLDDGAPTKILTFDSADGPLNLALLLDVSGGFTNEGVFHCTEAILQLLRPHDRIALLSFSDGDARRRAGFTSDPEDIRRAHRQIFTDDRNNSRRRVRNSHLFDAIRSGANLFYEASPMRRPVLLVVTHNREKGSAAKDRSVIDSLLESSVRLEAITIPQEWVSIHVRLQKPAILGFPTRSTRPPPPKPEFLDDLHSVEPIVSATGGQTIHLDFANAHRVPQGEPTGSEWNAKEIAQILDKSILARFRSQYSIGIRGAQTSKRQYRQLEVRLTQAAQRRNPNAVIHARAAYFTAAGNSDSKAIENFGRWFRVR